MSIIDDWLRQWPNLTLTRDQRETLEELIEELIEEEIDENRGNGDLFGEPDFDDPFEVEEVFAEGAEAMRKLIVEKITEQGDTAPADIIGLQNAIHMIEKLALPEMPEED